MPPATIILDHLVVAAGTLAEGSAYVERLLGSAPAGGGKHPAMGTHNRVLKLGRAEYLEVIAIDPQAQTPARPRWFALDDPTQQARLARRPRLVAWVARTDAVDRLAETVYDRPATVHPMQRGTLRWRFAFTTDGALPGDGTLPHLIQWATPLHPAGGMPESGCCLVGLDAAHNDPDVLKTLRSITDADPRITVQTPTTATPAAIRARIQTPAGVVVLD